MKKLLLLLSFIYIALSSAQTMMTNRDVYDFNIGDEFQTRVFGAPPNATRYSIVGKRFSANNDTVFYRRLFNSYSSMADYSTSPPHLVYSTSTNTDSVYYPDLDTLVNSPGKNWVVYACDSYRDSLYYSPTFCNDLIYEMWAVKSTNCAVEKIGYNYSYGKGIGQVLYYYNNTGNNFQSRYDLFYYKKGNVTCGTADTSGFTSINKINLATPIINIYPNPAQNNFTIETNASEKQTLQLFDVNSKLILIQSINNKTTIDVSHLNAGVYNLNITNSQGVLNKKLII
ncbi:MAG: T9SS type A sorting domain-containing protein, partial [Bacteroidia bacterium]